MNYPALFGSAKLFQWLVLSSSWILPACSQILDDPLQPMFQSYHSIEGKILNKNHVIKTFHSFTRHSTCMMKCASHSDCYSINFYAGRGVCELNNATNLSHPEGFMDDPTGTFLLYFFRSIGWCSDELCAGTGKRCYLNPDQSSFKCLDFCTAALGLEDRRIPDSALTASSTIPSSQPTACRLRNQDEWGAGTNQVGQYLQVDLNGIFKLTGIATQGHYQLEYWVTQYKISYRISKDRQLQFYKENGIVKIFNGNADKSSVVTNTFTIGFVARYVRIVVQSWNSWTAMRAELYGCQIN